jgi:hypothetical protein
MLHVSTQNDSQFSLYSHHYVKTCTFGIRVNQDIHLSGSKLDVVEWSTFSTQVVLAQLNGGLSARESWRWAGPNLLE